MAGKSPVKASDGQRTALEALAVSRNRGDADRARYAVDARLLDERADRRGVPRGEGHGVAMA